MLRRLSQRGLALILVIGFSLVVFLAVVALLFMLRANTSNLVSFKERAEAYYLCESGASIAIMDIAQGYVGKGDGQWTEKTFDYKMGEKTYKIHYVVEKENNAWKITASVGPDSGFSRTYKLRVGGRRAFPLFIRGFGGK